MKIHLKNQQHLRNILLVLIFISSVAVATEVDQYTYRNIPLADSKDAINLVINNYVEETLQKTNDALQRTLDRGHSVSVGSIESNFMYYWEQASSHQGFSVYHLAISNAEGCIKTNDCEKWPKIERIIHLPEESVYGRAEYGTVASRMTAPVINLCDIRIGGDKITHFLYDGRVYYHKYMSGEDGNELENTMAYIERGAMGLAYSQIYSYSDIYVNYRGVDFFKRIFQGNDPYIAYNILSKRLEQIKKVNICEYVNSSWDESFLPNSYGNYNTERLKRVIEQEIENPTPISKEELLSRSYQLKGMWSTLVLSTATLDLDIILSSRKFKDYSIFSEHRRPINIKVIGADVSDD